MLPTEKIQIEWNGEAREVPLPKNSAIEELAPGHYLVSTNGTTVEVFEAAGKLSDGGAIDGVELKVESDRERIIRERFNMQSAAGAGKAAGRVVKAPMPGMVRSVMVAVGDKVEKNTTLLVLEAMKMENNILAGTTGVISKVHVTQGTSVEKNAVLIEITSEPPI